MRILVLNPNFSEEITARLMSAAAEVTSPGVSLVAATAPRGVPYIATRAEAQIGGAIALEMLAERRGDFDAAIIAAFGDPGLFAARELFDVPIIGMAEAAMLTACMLGRRFAIVSFARALEPWFQECVDAHGMKDRCAAICMLDEPFAAVSDVQIEKQEALVAEANQAVRAFNAEAIILAGAPLAGLATNVRDRIPVPVVDPIAAAVKQAETLVALKLRKAVVGSFRRPDAKPTRGLPGALAARIEHADGRRENTPPSSNVSR